MSFSPAAIRSLVIADFIRETGITAEGIADLQMLQHAPDPAEPREELRYLRAVYTVTISAYQDGCYRTWIYVITSRGRVTVHSTVSVPLPYLSLASDTGDNCRSVLDE